MQNTSKTIQNTFDIILVRQNMLAEIYGGYLWEQHQQGTKMIITPAQVKLDQDSLSTIEGKTVLIVGGYYRGNMEPILNSARAVTVFYNSSDAGEHNNGYKTVVGGELTGFLAWTCQELSITEEYILKISEFLDAYLYGFPSDRAISFQNGVYVLDAATDLEKCLTITSLEDIETTIRKGQEKRINNRRIAEQRGKSAKQVSFKLGDSQYSALVGIGDSPIVDTCLFLAEKSPSGIGMLFRYDLNTQRTFISMRVTESSQEDAGDLMKRLVKGGGSKPMGGGSISGLFFPEQLLI